MLQRVRGLFESAKELAVGRRLGLGDLAQLLLLGQQGVVLSLGLLLPALRLLLPRLVTGVECDKLGRQSRRWHCVLCRRRRLRRPIAQVLLHGQHVLFACSLGRG